MKKLIPLLVLILIEGFASSVLSQDYSIRTNVLNLVAKGPSVALGKNIKDNSEMLLTYSSGSFRPFFFEDSYKYSTIHLEYRRKDDNSKCRGYYGGYLRYIHKRILSEGSYPFKSARNFKGNGMSTGLTSGIEWSLNSKWLMDFNMLAGAGKYLSQVDYGHHDRISVFFDMRVALQLGFRF